MSSLLLSYPVIDKIIKVAPWGTEIAEFGEFPSGAHDDGESCSEKCIRRNLLYQMKEIDMKATREYHKKYPPKVGNEVVVFNTSYGLHEKEHKRISAITERGRLIVEHRMAYAGVSFWKSGQNCKAPTGQTWLVPIELYEIKILNHEFGCKNFKIYFPETLKESKDYG